MDICNQIQDLNFDNNDDLKRILFRDKHTRIEGLCTEYLFRDEIVNNVFENHTSGFWFGFKNGSFSVTKILADTGDLNDIDYRVLNYFLSREVPTWIVFFDKSDKLFYYQKYTNENKDNLDLSTKKPYPKNSRKAYMPNQTDRNESRLNQAYDLLNDYHVLYSAAVERTFANCWLGSGSFWDIDAFAFHGEQLIAFEVKQKYPTRKGTFGLNTGLARLFTFLSSIEIRVVHVILTKPVRDASIPAIDLYTKPEYIDNCFWIATNFSTDILSDDTSIAPSRTSIFGNNTIRYYHIQPSHFHFIKNLRKQPNLIIDFLEGRTQNIQSLDDLKKQDE